MAYFPPTGSVVAFQSDPTKLVGTVSVIGTAGASIIGRPPVAVTNTPSISGTVEIGNTITINPVSVSGTVGSSVIGTVPVVQSGTVITSLVSTVPSSVIIGASIFGQLPAGTAPIGSVAVLQGTMPWTINSVYGNISGSVAAIVTNTPSISGAVQIGSVIGGPLPVTGLSFSISSVAQAGTWNVSVVGTYPEDTAAANADVGFLQLVLRNDAIASTVGTDLDYVRAMGDSAGRTVIKPFAPDENTFRFVTSVVSTSVTLIAASVAGKRAYITDYWAVNTGATTTRITFQDGSTSVVGYGIAPTASGSNSPGIAVPMRTAVGQDLVFQANTASSILYLTVNGYQAP